MKGVSSAAPPVGPQTGVSVENAHGTLTRAAVASALGCHVSTVRRLEGNYLHPTVDIGGVHRFDAVEVAAVRETRIGRGKRGAPSAGSIAARAFLMFESAKARREPIRLPNVVIELEVTPDVVRKLYVQWTTSIEDGEMIGDNYSCR